MLTLRRQDPVGRCLQSPMRTPHVCETEPESAYSRSGEQVELSPYHQEMRLAVYFMASQVNILELQF